MTAKVPLALTVITAVSALFAAIAAWRAAVATQRNAKAMRNSTRAMALLDLRKTYASENMLNGMHSLIDWYVKYGKEEFARIFAGFRAVDYAKVADLDKDRRRFSHFLIGVHSLHKHGIMDEQFVKSAVPIAPANLAVVLIEPMEAEINEKYDRGPFDMLRKIYGEELRDELQYIAYGKQRQSR